MTVPVQTEPSFTPGTPEVLFEGDYVLEVGGRTHDVSPDGQRLLMLKEGGSGGSQDTPPNRFIVVENWFEELRQRVPTGQ